MRYWLLKSEPDVFGFQHLKKCKKQTEPWNGIRNYQARNFMRDDMKVGDLALFYHSNTTPPGIAGVVRISKEAYPDDLQFDPQSDYYDAKSTQDKPRWLMVDVTLEAADRYHLECVTAGGTEIAEAEVLGGKTMYRRHYLPQMWRANLTRLRRSDPDLFAG